MSKRSLPAGLHVAFVLTRKEADKVHSTPGCRCGWRGDETPSRATALDRFDAHIRDEKGKLK